MRRCPACNSDLLTPARPRSFDLLEETIGGASYYRDPPVTVVHRGDCPAVYAHQRSGQVRDGCEAARKGVLLAHCPFPDGSLEEIEWAYGWVMQTAATREWSPTK